MVLIAGGENFYLSLASAKVYDPATATFTATGGMNVPTQGHTATLLPNGQVLIAGGFDQSIDYAAAELYQ
jgi:hypothetical protein